MRKETKLKKYILAVVLVLLFASVGICNTDLSKLAGKQIYRDIPAKNKSEFSMEFVGKSYQLIYYNDTLIELKDLDGRTFIRGRDLWDDGNWKLWDDRTQIRNLIGKKIYRTVPCKGDKSYINDPRKLLEVKDNDLILSGWKEDEEPIKLSRSKWDDGNWIEFIETKHDNGNIDELKKLIGKMIYRVAPLVTGSLWFKFYTDSPGKLLSVDKENIVIEDIDAFGGKMALCTETWNDGNWKEYVRAGYFFLTYGKCSTKTEWYVGQEVWDIIKGRGTVVCTSVENSNKINVKFDVNLFADWHDIDTYTLSGKYKESQAQRLFSTEIKSVVYDLDKLFSIKEIKRLSIKQVMPQSFFSLEYSIQSQYSCAKCGKRLYLNFCGYNYYCNKCNIEFDIKER